MEQPRVLRWFDVQSVPGDYSFPLEDRPGRLPIPLCDTVPVIDLHKSTTSPEKWSMVRQIVEASQEYGFFQVINHGVSEDVVRETSTVFKEFFNMYAEDKKGTSASDGDLSRGWIYMNSSSVFAKDGIHLWRDNVKLACHPLEECMQGWPPKPTRYREVVATYVEEMRRLSGRILELICEGLGLEAGYLERLSQVQLVVGNYYPPCPDPSLTLGLLKHCDPSLITILLQEGNACGLQVLHNGKWIGVAPLPNALVVNIGNQLEIISNGKLKSAEHRAVTNSYEARISIATFINPSHNSIVEPAKVLVDELNPPRYAPTLYKDFAHTSKVASTEATKPPAPPDS
ncbi:hyoscyamine 6-dioxygenase-like [Coffea eugenioides]|uniref:hyoscyamine 6-dioxygenase-like n=1 Tax=Coffea eugenioides TaxID=49369 RepID=UPI000F615A09|nr:hyoscyamine 6-dioxygenase-like [Coffea eugenioides]